MPCEHLYVPRVSMWGKQMTPHFSKGMENASGNHSVLSELKRVIRHPRISVSSPLK